MSLAYCSLGNQSILQGWFSVLEHLDSSRRLPRSALLCGVMGRLVKHESRVSNARFIVRSQTLVGLREQTKGVRVKHVRGRWYNGTSGTVACSQAIAERIREGRLVRPSCPHPLPEQTH